MKIFHYSPDAAGGGTASAGGSQVTSGSAGSSNGQSGTQPAGLPGEGKTNAQLNEENRFITPETLKGVLLAKERSQKEDLEKLSNSFAEKFNGITKMLEDLGRAKPQEAKKDGDVEDSEKIDLKRRLKDQEETISKVQKELETTRQREKKNRREQDIKAALVRQGCSNVELVCRMIDPDLSEKAETGELYAYLQSEFGKEQVSVDDYIKRFVAKEQIPQLFASTVKQGAPAGGDAAGGAKFKYKRSQLNDPKFYQANREDIHKALEAKQVDFDH